MPILYEHSDDHWLELSMKVRQKLVTSLDLRVRRNLEKYLAIRLDDKFWSEETEKGLTIDKKMRGEIMEKLHKTKLVKFTDDGDQRYFFFNRKPFLTIRTAPRKYAHVVVEELFERWDEF